MCLVGDGIWFCGDLYGYVRPNSEQNEDKDRSLEFLKVGRLGCGVIAVARFRRREAEILEYCLIGWGECWRVRSGGLRMA